MLALAAKALVSGLLIALISEIGRRLPALAALLAALPLVSVLGMVLLWHAKPDAANVAEFSLATFWFVLPSLPMFVLIAWLLRQGTPFWLSLALGCALTIVLTFAMVQLGPRFGLKL
jgi:hypothetical protein